MLALRVPTTVLDASIDGFQLAEDEFVVDALFGSGLTHAPTGWIRALIAAINAAGNAIISIDLPSGMVHPGSDDAFDPDACIRARFTLTFELPRLALLLPESGPFAGNWELIPIGLDRATVMQAEREASWVERARVGQLLRPVSRFSHKGTLGHALIVAGSRGMYGAAVLSTMGALRSGSGLVTTHLPGELATQLPTVLPDAMTSIDPKADRVSQLPDLERYTAIGVGPGIGQYPECKGLLLHAFHEAKVPLVLDADALNLIAADKALRSAVPAGSVLTPHPKEMDRLLGTVATDGYDRLQRSRGLAQELRSTIVLKGAYTCICAPDGELYFNSTGNVGMAKGGSGDVLTGLLTGLIAQGYSAECAAVIGVYLHGSAGDICRMGMGMEAMRPSDLVDRLPQAWSLLWSASEQALE
ncbi:MAG: NAD(P)H-hydrate dehydratase [Flavobacteriales bacterium]